MGLQCNIFLKSEFSLNPASPKVCSQLLSGSSNWALSVPGAGAACHGFTAWQADVKWNAKADPSDDRAKYSRLNLAEVLRVPLHFLLWVNNPTYITEAPSPTQNSPVKTLMLGKVHAFCWKAYLFSMDSINTFLWEPWLILPKKGGEEILHRFREWRFLSVYISIIPTIILWLSTSAGLVPLASHHLPQSTDLSFCSLDLHDFAIFCLSPVPLCSFLCPLCSCTVFSCILSSSTWKDRQKSFRGFERFFCKINPTISFIL